MVHLAGGHGFPKNAKVRLTVTRPTASAGTLLVKAKKPQPPVVQKGDTTPARHATMLALEKSSRKPLIAYAEHKFDLSNDPVHTGSARSSGLYGSVLKDFLNVEGTYTFHAVATYAYRKDCNGSRELQWSAEVEVGGEGVAVHDTQDVG